MVALKQAVNFSRIFPNLIKFKNLTKNFNPMKSMHFPDPRTRGWFLVDSPGLLLTILVAYLYFCKVAGPRMMKNRKPFELKGFMLAYNAFQVVFSAYIAWEVRYNTHAHTKILSRSIKLFRLKQNCSAAHFHSLRLCRNTYSSDSKQTSCWQIQSEFFRWP